MHYKRLLFVFTVLVIFIIYSVAIVIAQSNPIIKKLFYRKEVEVEVPKEKIVYVDREVEKEIYYYQFYCTGYSPNDPSQGTNEIMSSGKRVYEGAVAVDTSIIPLGTELEIRGLPNGWDGVYYAEDTGGAIKGLHIDVFRWEKFEALQINCDVWVRFLKD